MLFGIIYPCRPHQGQLGGKSDTLPDFCFVLLAFHQNIDILRLSEGSDGDLELEMDFHEAFREEGVKIMSDIEKAVATKDNHELGQQAHKLKGSALTIGYPEISATTLKMEHLSKEGQFAKAAALFSRLKKQMRDVDNVMTEYFSRRSELQKKEPKKTQ